MNPRIHSTTRRITDHDNQALSLLLRCMRGARAADGWSLFQLRQVLRATEVCPTEALPDETVRLGSSCAVWLDHLGELLRFTLCLPDGIHDVQGGVSILSPVGLAVLGHRQGMDLLAPIPGGMGCFRIFRASPPARPASTTRVQTHRTASICHRQRAMRVAAA